MRRKYTDKQAVVAISDTSLTTLRAVARSLGVAEGDTYTVLRRIAQENKLDTSHWRGLAHAKGKPSPRRKHAEFYLKLNGPRISTYQLMGFFYVTV